MYCTSLWCTVLYYKSSMFVIPLTLFAGVLLLIFIEGMDPYYCENINRENIIKYL